MTGTQAPLLSLIIPAYNEEARIEHTLAEVLDYLGSQSYAWEVVVVDDGSTDATAALVEEYARARDGLRLIRVPHEGKGWAVNRGVLATTGEYRFLCDADLSMPIEQLSRFLPPELSDFDVAVGSREVSGAKRIGEPPGRHAMGRVYNLLVRMMAVPGLLDTQCGFKCFRGEVAQELFTLQTLYTFGFDVEVLFIARKRRLRIKEVAIDWHYRSQSKVRPVRDSIAMTGDILKIRWNSLVRRYEGRRR